MGLLDGGIASTFSSVFGAYFLDGILHVLTRTEADDGDVTVTQTDIPIKGQVDQVSEAARAAAGYTEDQQRLIILQAGLAQAPTTDDEITLGGRRWTIASVESDPANSHWIIRGQRA